MKLEFTISRYCARFPLAAVFSYVGVIGGLVVVIWITLSDIYGRERALAETADLLDRLDGRNSKDISTARPAGQVPVGSPFLEGPTITVAGAALLQRVAGAIVKVGGTVQSSQVDVQGAQLKNGFVSLVVSCEMDQLSLQKVLYDIEAGMPFLFVDQLDLQVPQVFSTTDAGGGRIRVMMGVSGQWQGNK